MNKSNFTGSQHDGQKNHRPRQTMRLLSGHEESEVEVLAFCVACLVAGVTKPAIGHTFHPEYRRLALCGDCIAHYESAVVE
jgi:hypothetical protein